MPRSGTRRTRTPRSRRSSWARPRPPTSRWGHPSDRASHYLALASHKITLAKDPHLQRIASWGTSDGRSCGLAAPTTKERCTRSHQFLSLVGGSATERTWVVFVSNRGGFWLPTTESSAPQGRHNVYSAIKRAPSPFYTLRHTSVALPGNKTSFHFPKLRPELVCNFIIIHVNCSKPFNAISEPSGHLIPVQT